MECLDELSLGARGQVMGIDMDCPPAASSTIADPPGTSADALQVSFDMPWEALVHLSPAIRCELDPTSSEFISHSWDLLPGVLLHVIPPTSVLRQHVQMLHHLDAELDFAVDFPPALPCS